MLLRTRITLILGAAILLIGCGVHLIGQAEQRSQADRLAQIAVTLQTSLWESLVQQRLPALEDEAAAVAAVLAREAPDLERVAVADIVDSDLTKATVQVINRTAGFVAANSPLLSARPLVDQKVLDRLSSDRGGLSGVRQDTPDRFVILAVAPVIVDEQIVGAVSASSDASDLLAALSRELGEPAYLLSPRGRLATGTDPELWGRAQASIDRRLSSPRFIDVGTQSYFAAPIPLTDIAGGRAGTLVALRDVSASRAEARQTQSRGLIAIAMLAVIIVIGAYLVMRQAFKPLEGAVSALDALAKGDFSKPLDAGGAAEISRIGKAVTVFRRNAVRLVEQDDAIARQRRRQERVIRRELERLATLLDETGRAEILGDLSGALNTQDDGTARSHAELATLATLLQRMSHRIASQHGRLTNLIEELRASISTRERLAAIEQELDIARALQTSFLPKELPPHPSFEVFGLMQSAKEVGGDFFDAFLIDPDRLAIVVADVSGKGVPAALFMAISRTLVRANADGAREPAQTITRVNEVLAADNDQMMFVTLFYGVLDLSNGEFTTVNAGHNPPYLVRGGKVVALPRASAPALGVVEDISYPQTTQTLMPEDLVFVFTDGVTEAFDEEERAYGENRLTSHLEEHSAGLSAHEVATSVRDDVLKFEGAADQADDITCFALRFKGGARPASTKKPAG
ncbi:MAG: SpoIIE family protein phosphatase [Pseudomonadota bacterium]